MSVSKYPKVKLGFFPTPLQKANQLTKYLGGPNIYIKRDDMTGLLLGGNKARKLEYLIADALEKKIDVIITAGRTQSNWLAQVAAASKMFNIETCMVINGKKDESKQGNYLLDRMLDAKFEFISNEDYQNNLDSILHEIAKSYEKKGLEAYILPRGGSTAIGNLGYVDAILELLFQASQINVKIDYVVVATGSCGTTAGILTGIKGFNQKIKTLGISVGRPKKECIIQIELHNEEIAKMLGDDYRVNKEDIIIFDQYIGEGYGKRTEQAIDAIELTLNKEGILLDPVYTGKAMAGLIDLINNQYFKKEDNVVFLHSGGYGGIFGHSDYFL